MSKKRRVYQVAKEFNISHEALIDFLQKLRFDIRNHMSQVTEPMLEEIVKHFSEPEVEPTSGDYEFRKMLKDKKLQEEKKKKDAAKEVEERLRTASIIAAERPKEKKKAAKEVNYSPGFLNISGRSNSL